MSGPSSPHISRNNSFKNLRQYKDFSSSAPASPLTTSYQGSLDEVEDIPTAVVIKNIPFSLKKDGLLYLMISRGIPTPYALNYHYDNGTFRGLAFANYKNADETLEAMKGLNDLEIGGRKLRVEFKRQLFSVQQMLSLQKDKNSTMQQSRNQQITMDSPNDDRMTELYDQLLEFCSDPNRDTFTPDTFSGKERKDVHLIAEQLGLIHQSIGSYPDRGVQVRKKDAQSLNDDIDVIESKSKLINVSDIVIDLPSKRDSRKPTLQNSNNNNQQEGISPIRQPLGPDLSKNFESRKSVQNLSLSEIFIRQHMSNISIVS